LRMIFYHPVFTPVSPGGGRSPPFVSGPIPRCSPTLRPIFFSSCAPGRLPFPGERVLFPPPFKRPLPPLGSDSLAKSFLMYRPIFFFPALVGKEFFFLPLGPGIPPPVRQNGPSSSIRTRSRGSFFFSPWPFFGEPALFFRNLVQTPLFRPSLGHGLPLSTFSVFSPPRPCLRPPILKVIFGPLFSPAFTHSRG